MPSPFEGEGEKRSSSPQGQMGGEWGLEERKQQREIWSLAIVLVPKQLRKEKGGGHS